ncbi:MAG: hypothetical protein H8D55_00800, partial [Deltaproteobacteria bacterium]|nr:hypothetical protein [Deltaproteobacteria bacterium]
MFDCDCYIVVQSVNSKSFFLGMTDNEKTFRNKDSFSNGTPFVWLPVRPICFFIHGCTDHADLVLVDFSKTQAPARSESPRQGRPLLKIAVAAMISPKETFSYYRQLLDYIGDNLDRKIQIIQRKTYGEINELLA